MVLGIPHSRKPPWSWLGGHFTLPRPGESATLPADLPLLCMHQSQCFDGPCCFGNCCKRLKTWWAMFVSCTSNHLCCLLHNDAACNSHPGFAAAARNRKAGWVITVKHHRPAIQSTQLSLQQEQVFQHIRHIQHQMRDSTSTSSNLAQYWAVAHNTWLSNCCGSIKILAIWSGRSLVEHGTPGPRYQRVCMMVLNVWWSMDWSMA